MYLKCGLTLRRKPAMPPLVSESTPGDVTEVPTNSTAREPAPLAGL
jgi:hypothetical protein